MFGRSSTSTCCGFHARRRIESEGSGSLPATALSRSCGALDKAYTEGLCDSTEIHEFIDHALLDGQEDHKEVEEIARIALEKNFSYEALEKIAKNIDFSKSRSVRHKKDGKLDHDEGAFIGGLWQFGGKHGITKGTRMYPTVCKYFNAFFRERGYSGWTSFYLGKNVQTAVHSDHHNLRDTNSVTVTFGNFRGGRLWLASHDQGECSAGAIEKVDRAGRLLRGEYAAHGFRCP